VVRLQKFLAEAGVASRRASERIILDGRVCVNGKQVCELGVKVHPESDEVVVDGKAVRAKRRLYVVLHKPRGCVCSRNDEHGRPRIFDLLPKEWQNLYSVGRLDFASEGLLFLTNDGEFALRLTHPRYGVRKKYVASVEGRVDDAMLRQFERGVWHDCEKLRAERARLVSAAGPECVVELEMAEGKNREVRRMFASQGLTVKRLVRTQIGRIKLGELKSGRWRTLTPTEIKTLLS